MPPRCMHTAHHRQERGHAQTLLPHKFASLFQQRVTVSTTGHNLKEKHDTLFLVETHNTLIFSKNDRKNANNFENTNIFRHSI